MTYLEFIATIVIGYILGRLSGVTKEQITDDMYYVKKKFHDPWPFGKPKRVGAVQTPTQKDIMRKENLKLAEEEDEMRKAFQAMDVENRQVTDNG